MEVKDLAKEIRDHKIETDDRLATLESIVLSLGERLAQIEAKPPIVNLTNITVPSSDSKLRDGLPPEEFRPVGAAKKAKT